MSTAGALSLSVILFNEVMMGLIKDFQALSAIVPQHRFSFALLDNLEGILLVEAIPVVHCVIKQTLGPGAWRALLYLCDLAF